MVIEGWSLERLGEWAYRLCLDFGSTPETAHRVAAEFAAGIREVRRTARSAATLALVALCLAGCRPVPAEAPTPAELGAVPCRTTPFYEKVCLLTFDDGTRCAVGLHGGVTCEWPHLAPAVPASPKKEKQ